MKIGIIGLPQVGKKILFTLLTQGRLRAESKSSASKSANVGVSKVLDPRIDKLTEIYHPAKVTHAAIEYVLLPRIEKDHAKNQAAFLAIQDVDAVCHVVRAFQDDSVFHMEGSVGPLRDIAMVNTELILNDLVIADRRVERLAKEIAAKPDKAKEIEYQALLRCKEALEKETPLRELAFSPEEAKAIRTYRFLTQKGLLLVLNVGEGEIAKTESLQEAEKDFQRPGVKVLQVSVKTELEISELSPEEEREFLKELGIRESALDQMTRFSYEVLGLISYFTVGTDEVRAWTIRKGQNAQEAGGAIHSDIERGFIRAEMMKYGDLIQLGSEEKVQQAGKWHLKGKEYIVEDGDILSFRFSV